MKKIALVCTCLSLIYSCTKTNEPSDSVSGTWVFKQQVMLSYAYPSVITQPYPIATANWSITSDSISVSFDGKGNYTFLNFRWPVDQGRYTIAQDSFLIIKPDTADFIKFNYTALGFTTTTTGGTPIIQQPYAGFKFYSDTLLFARSGAEIVFSGAWLSKAGSPIIPSGDTIILNQMVSTFKKE